MDKKIENQNIKNMDSNKPEKISDGNHTFDELYDHRSVLFASLCNLQKDKAWKSKKYEDGADIEDDYFIAGIGDGAIRYHTKLEFWDLFDIEELETCKHWDGSTPADCLKELKDTYCKKALKESDIFNF